MARLRPAEALRRVVRRAVELRADAVLFAGDVVESGNALFEAYGDLRQAVARLLDAGVTVVGVAGNHDVEVLPRLARELEGFALLGEGGEWRTHLVRRGERPVARVLGWSFPSRAVSESPFARFPDAWRAGRYGDGAPDEIPTLGLVHGALGASGGPYAPISPADLRETRCDAWLLGHEHGPTLDPSAVRPAGYLGSVTALHPGELGPHGPWLAEVAEGRVALRHVPLAPLRFERVEIALDGLASPGLLETEVIRAVEGLHARIGATLEGTEAVGVRVACTGRRAFPASALEEVARRAGEELRVPSGDALYFVESVRDESRPALDLDRLAEGSDPVAVLARRVRALQRDPESAEELLGPLRGRLGDAARHPHFAELAAGETAERGAAERALRVARRLLEELLRQRDDCADPEPAR